MTNRDLIEAFWGDLYRRDYATVGAYFSETGEYTDVASPSDDVARGPARIAARLQLGLQPLASLSHDIRLMVCEGDTVVTEHVEHWEWPTGERVSLPFVSIQEIRAGQLVRWWDYWDMGTLMGAAPQWWIDQIMAESARVDLRDADGT